jgi:hypothetical protein
MPLWTPDLFNPCFWLDADDASTITKSGSRVTYWHDKAPRHRGNINRHRVAMSNVSTGVSMSTINGVPAVDFAFYENGVAASSVCPDLMYYRDAISVFAVAKTNYTGGNNVAYAFAYGSSYPLSLTIRVGENVVRASGNTADSSSGVESVDHAYTDADSNARLVAGLYNYAGNTLHVGINGTYTERSGGFKTASSATDGIAAKAIYLNFLSTQSNGVLGQLGEVVVLNGALSDAQRWAIEGYLAHKWGLDGSLPAGHPYLLYPPWDVGDGVIIPEPQAAISGNATRVGGGAVRVLVIDGPSGALIEEAEPDSEGDWTATVPYDRAHYLTYLGDYCDPITHGPYTVDS